MRSIGITGSSSDFCVCAFSADRCSGNNVLGASFEGSIALDSVSTVRNSTTLKSWANTPNRNPPKRLTMAIFQAVLEEALLSFWANCSVLF